MDERNINQSLTPQPSVPNRVNKFWLIGGVVILLIVIGDIWYMNRPNRNPSSSPSTASLSGVARDELSSKFSIFFPSENSSGNISKEQLPAEIASLVPLDNIFNSSYQKLSYDNGKSGYMAKFDRRGMSHADTDRYFRTALRSSQWDIIKGVRGNIFLFHEASNNSYEIRIEASKNSDYHSVLIQALEK